MQMFRDTQGGYPVPLSKYSSMGGQTDHKVPIFHEEAIQSRFWLLTYRYCPLPRQAIPHVTIERTSKTSHLPHNRLQDECIFSEDEHKNVMKSIISKKVDEVLLGHGYPGQCRRLPPYVTNSAQSLPHVSDTCHYCRKTQPFLPLRQHTGLRGAAGQQLIYLFHLCEIWRYGDLLCLVQFHSWCYVANHIH